MIPSIAKILSDTEKRLSESTVEELVPLIQNNL